MKTLTALAVMLAFAFTLPAYAAHKTSSAQDALTQAKVQLKHHVATNRHVAWRWQDKAGIERSETRLLERRASVPYLRTLVHMWWKRAHHAMKSYATVRYAPVHYGGDASSAICAVFGTYCSQALAVARCESGLSVYASNGQYLGLFQMGEYARARYGHSSDAGGQARSAFAYFRDSGYSWGPWQCKP